MYNCNWESINYLSQYCFTAKELQNNNSRDRSFNVKPNDMQQFINFSQGKFSTNTKQKFHKKGTINPYNFPSTKEPNLIFLTPAIFGSVVGFILGFRFFGHNLTTGYERYIYFLNIYTFIASMGVGFFIYESRIDKTSLYEVLLPALLLMFYFGTIFNLTYSLYPDTFSGSIDAFTPISQFVVFLSLGITSISVGGTVDVVPQKPGVKMLFSIAGLFSLFIFSIIISLVT